MVPSILFLGEVVVVVELIEVEHFSRIFDLSHFRDPPDQVRGAWHTRPHTPEAIISVRHRRQKCKYWCTT